MGWAASARNWKSGCILGVLQVETTELEGELGSREKERHPGGVRGLWPAGPARKAGRHRLLTAGSQELSRWRQGRGPHRMAQGTSAEVWSEGEAAPRREVWGRPMVRNQNRAERVLRAEGPGKVR